jgi:filamentous hemagglutinin family protein
MSETTELFSRGLTQMARNIKQGCNWLRLVLVLGVSEALLFNANCVLAQVIPDTSLPINSAVTVNGNNSTITGGTQLGSNLFHSFGQFSVPTNGEGFFNNAASVQNIISRVTGLLPSTIDGSLRANGAANLFLLNPNGIIFGENARLNVGGSFVGSTASSLNFADGTQFGTTNPQAPPLLTISVPTNLQFGSNPGSIINSSRVTNSSGEIVGLSVQPGATLALVGGEVAVSGGYLTSPGGRVDLGSVAANNSVSLTPTNPGWLLGYQGITNFQNVSLTNAAKIAVNGDGKGKIGIQANNIDISSQSNLTSGINGGLQFSGSQVEDISLNASGKLTLSDGATILARSFGKGDAGNIGITANAISINGKDTSVSSKVFPGAEGNSGIINLKAPEVRVFDDATINASLEGTGTGGKIAIDAARVSISKASMVADTLGTGNAGSIAINATDDISIDGVGTVLGTQVAKDAVGNGGTINLNAPNLSLSGGATIVANTLGQGNAGNIGITATNNISIAGSGTGVGSQVLTEVGGNGGTINLNAPLVNLSDGATIVGNTQGTGIGGKIAIDAARVSISKASIAANTLGKGNAGSIAINATDDISIDGVGTVLATQVFQDAVGNGGTINLNAPLVNLSGGATIVANTEGLGNAGSIEINATKNISIVGKDTGVGSQVFADAGGNGGTINLNAPLVNLSGGATIVANTQGKGNAGSIGITATDTIFIDGEKTGVGSQVLTAEAGGNGGKINLNAREVDLSGGATIVANTEGKGNAGNIEITATDNISIDGKDTGVGSVAFANSGFGGNVNLTTGRLAIANSGQLNVSSLGQRTAGDITVQADSIRLDNQGKILAETAFGDGGNINLNLKDLLLLRRNSLISTTAGIASGAGNGGNIKINIPNGFIVAVPNENSDITANASRGKGGSVEINSAGNYFITPLSREELQRLRPLDLDPRKLQTNDITAISRENPNLSGQVTINTSNFDPNRGLVALPTGVVDVSTLVASGCGAGDGTTGNQFTVTGRGGLPPSPEEPLSANAVWSDTRVTNIAPSQDKRTLAPVSPMQKVQEIVPATGWVFSGKGKVTLVSNKSSAATSRMMSANCSQR